MHRARRHRAREVKGPATFATNRARERQGDMAEAVPIGAKERGLLVRRATLDLGFGLFFDYRQQGRVRHTSRIGWWRHLSARFVADLLRLCAEFTDGSVKFSLYADLRLC